MPRTAWSLTTALVVAAAVVVLAQTTPQKYLNDAKQTLDSIVTSGLKQDEAKQIGDLKGHFADLWVAYAASSGAPAAAGAAPVSTGQQGGSTWQAKYATVHSDLILMGDVGEQTKGQLDQFRARLEMFYNAALDQAIATATAPPPQTPLVQTSACPSVVATVSRESVSLLDRMQTIVDNTLSGKVPTDEAVATSGSKEIREAGKVSIDRASLDEIRAEVGHLKLLLQESSAR